MTVKMAVAEELLVPAVHPLSRSERGGSLSNKTIARMTMRRKNISSQINDLRAGAVESRNVVSTVPPSIATPRLGGALTSPYCVILTLVTATQTGVVGVVFAAANGWAEC